MDLSVSAVAGISRATRPVSSDTQIAVLQRRLEALDKQRAQAASSTDETATYRLQALTQQMGLLQTQIAQLQQAAASAASTQATSTDDSTEEEKARTETAEATRSTESTENAQTTRRAREVAEDDDVSATQQAQQSQEAQAAARRDATAVAKARAEGATVGTNVDTYA